MGDSGRSDNESEIMCTLHTYIVHAVLLVQNAFSCHSCTLQIYHKKILLN